MNNKLKELLIKLKYKRLTQKTYCTDTPIYLVQKSYDIIVNEDYETPSYYRLYIKEFVDDDFYPTLDDILHNGALDSIELDDDIIDEIKKQNNIYDIVDILNRYNIKTEIIPCCKTWKTVAYFLTLEDANNYMKYQSHNLGECRLYVDTVGYDNRGLLAQMLRMLDKKNEEL